MLLHVHDIFLPDPYPAAWDWRGYNEQAAVAPLIHQDAGPVQHQRRRQNLEIVFDFEAVGEIAGGVDDDGCGR